MEKIHIFMLIMLLQRCHDHVVHPVRIRISVERMRLTHPVTDSGHLYEYVTNIAFCRVAEKL